VRLYENQPVLGIVVEVQLAQDSRKRYAWPVYAVGLRARMHACAVRSVSSSSPRTASSSESAATGSHALGDASSTSLPSVTGPISDGAMGKPFTYFTARQK
jgi:hypothetical protein